MSMNLAFRTKDGFLVEFPYQTSTRTSYRVIEETSRSKIMKILRRDFYYNTHLSLYDKRVLRECKNLLRNKNLTLIIM